MMSFDRETLWLLSGVLGVLIFSSLIAFVLTKKNKSEAKLATLKNLNDRIKAWWVMCGIFALTVAGGEYGSVALFAVLSFVALREFKMLIEPIAIDRWSWVIALVVILPLHYAMVAAHWYGMFSIFIPVYVFLLIPTLATFTGETGNFLARTAKLQWALLAGVYCLSHVPGLLMLEIPAYSGNEKLVLYLVIVTQISDVLQYTFGKLFGRHKIAPNVSPNKTWAGFLGGVLSASAIGAGLWWATPFTPLQSFGMSLVITLMGFAGGLTMSAVKRDAGVKDYGQIIKGHGGILDRVDSLCFAAPIFFHIVRFYFT
ncbi:MAG: phosphatidate cytidylyltransferase [Bdellovibrionota bacterium]